VNCVNEIGSRRPDVSSHLNLMPLLLTLLRHPAVKSSDHLQLIITLNHCLDGARSFTLSHSSTQI